MEIINFRIRKFKTYQLLFGYYLISFIEKLHQVQLTTAFMKAISEVISCVYNLDFRSLRLYHSYLPLYTHLSLVRKLRRTAFLALVLA